MSIWLRGAFSDVSDTLQETHRRKCLVSSGLLIGVLVGMMILISAGDPMPMVKSNLEAAGAAMPGAMGSGAQSEGDVQAVMMAAGDGQDLDMGRAKRETRDLEQIVRGKQEIFNPSDKRQNAHENMSWHRSARRNAHWGRTARKHAKADLEEMLRAQIVALAPELFLDVRLNWVDDVLEDGQEADSEGVGVVDISVEGRVWNQMSAKEKIELLYHTFDLLRRKYVAYSDFIRLAFNDHRQPLDFHFDAFYTAMIEQR